MFVPKSSWKEKTKMALLVLAAMDPGLRIDDGFLKTMGCPDMSCPQLPVRSALSALPFFMVFHY